MVTPFSTLERNKNYFLSSFSFYVQTSCLKLGLFVLHLWIGGPHCPEYKEDEGSWYTKEFASWEQLMTSIYVMSINEGMEVSERTTPFYKYRQCSLVLLIYATIFDNRISITCTELYYVILCDTFTYTLITRLLNLTNNFTNKTIYSSFLCTYFFPHGTSDRRQKGTWFIEYDYRILNF